MQAHTTASHSVGRSRRQSVVRLSAPATVCQSRSWSHHGAVPSRPCTRPNYIPVIWHLATNEGNLETSRETGQACPGSQLALRRWTVGAVDRDRDRAAGLGGRHGSQVVPCAQRRSSGCATGASRCGSPPTPTRSPGRARRAPGPAGLCGHRGRARHPGRGRSQLFASLPDARVLVSAAKSHGI